MASNGRPSEYLETYPAELIEKMGEGKFDYEIYSQWKVSRDTFCRWKREKPELAEAYQIGKSLCLTWWTAKMRERFLEGDDKGYKYCQIIVSTKFAEFNVNSPQNLNQINIQNLQVINSPEDYQKLLDQVKTKAKDLNLLDILPAEFQEIKEENETPNDEHF